MFTVKYRAYELGAQQPDNGPYTFAEMDRIEGPYASVSTRWEDGYLTVHCQHRDLATPGMSYGPVISPEDGPMAKAPRPVLWVMNETGATIARYDL